MTFNKLGMKTACAFDEGMDAYDNGDPLDTSNPYCPLSQSVQWEEFIYGWLAAENGCWADTF